MSAEITIRAMVEGDLEEADRVFRRAFGTFFGLPDPMNFRGDAGLIDSRWHSYPDGGVVAARDGTMIGFSFASQWGSLGVFGPVAVLPEYWKQGIARQMLGPTLDIFARRQSRMVGLFTFPQSAMHLRLYQDFGFWPRFLTPILAKPIAGPHRVPGAIALSTASDRAVHVDACRDLTESIYDGLDLGGEIANVLDRGLGDTILLREDGAVAGFAVCHSGAGSEGGSQSCYIKFGLVRSGDGAAARLARLVAACEDFARARGVDQISAGVSTGRHEAYRAMLGMGFRIQLPGVTMHRPYVEGYDRPDVFALEDWR